MSSWSVVVLTPSSLVKPCHRNPDLNLRPAQKRESFVFS